MKFKKMLAYAMTATMLTSSVYVGGFVQPVEVQAADTNSLVTSFLTKYNALTPANQMVVREAILKSLGNGEAGKGWDANIGQFISEAQFKAVSAALEDAITNPTAATTASSIVAAMGGFSTILNTYATALDSVFSSMEAYPIERDGNTFKFKNATDYDAVKAKLNLNGADLTKADTILKLFKTGYNVGAEYGDSFAALLAIKGVTISAPSKPDPGNGGGGVSGGGGGGGTTEPTSSEVKTTTNTDGSITAEIIASSANIAKNEVVVKEAGKADVKSVTFKVSAPTGAAEVTVKVTPAVLKILTDLKIDVVILDLGSAKIELPVSVISGTEAVEIDFVKEDMKKVSADLLALVDASKSQAYTINLKKGGKEVHENLGKLCKLMFKYTLPTGANKNHVSVRFFNPDTKKLESQAGVYSAGEVKFKTSHFSTYVVTTESKSFSDVYSGYWAKDQIETLASKGVIAGRTSNDGTPNGKFDPGAKITRAEFATMVSRLIGAQDNSIMATSYKDVVKGNWFVEEVGSLEKLSIKMGGRTGENFDPNAAITREEMFSLMASVLYNDGYKAVADTKALDKFTDKASVSDYALKDIALLVGNSMVSGKTSTTLEAKGTATRAEAAQIMDQFLKKQ